MINLPFLLRRRSVRLPLLAVSSCLFLLPSCRRGEISTYLAPKDVEFSATAAGTADDGDGHDPAPAPTPEVPPIAYTAPDNWEKLPRDRMNAAQFQCSTPQGDVTINVTSLASMEGRETMLVGMWRGVFGLPELSEEEAKKALSPIPIGGMPGQMFEVIGDRQGQPLSIVTAFAHLQGKSWFFKLQGPPPAVDSQKAAFTAFLATVKF
ncbi:MAG: hypothetical protein JWM59_1725 [Verrucomicrobiales bacterium]|nr:hypothetical protein [Verrucomicrobiales bacterium]